MNRLVAFFAIVFFSVAFVSCEKGIDINDDYKETTIVYGLIDPADSISYIRIEKAFLTDGDVFLAAQVPDSNLFSYKLDVKLRGENGDVVVTFDTITIYNKNEGIFYSPEMLVYYAVTKDLLNEEDTYKLEINNPNSALQVSAESQFIDGSRLKINKPNLTMTFTSNYAVKFESRPNIRLYQANIRFHFMEEHIETGDSTWHFVDWVLPTASSQFLTGGEDLEIPYSGDAFFANLENNIPIKDNIIRREGQIEVIVSMADETFNLYLDINKPSASLVIDRPAFTNIENGYGIFASRSRKVKLSKLNSGSHAILMGIESLQFRDGNGN